MLADLLVLANDRSVTARRTLLERLRAIDSTSRLDDRSRELLNTLIGDLASRLEGGPRVRSYRPCFDTHHAPDLSGSHALSDIFTADDDTLHIIATGAPDSHAAAIVMSRGSARTRLALARNPQADLSRPTLVALADLAPGDAALRRALASRSGLPATVAERLWPCLPPAERAMLLSASSAIDPDEAVELVAERELGLHLAIRSGRLAESLDVLRGRMAKGQIGLDEAIVELARADRAWDIACLIGERLDLPGTNVLALITCGLDLGPAVLAAGMDIGRPAQAALHQLRLKRRWRAADLGRVAAVPGPRLGRDEADAILAFLRDDTGPPRSRVA